MLNNLISYFYTYKLTNSEINIMQDKLTKILNELEDWGDNYQYFFDKVYEIDNIQLFSQYYIIIKFDSEYNSNFTFYDINGKYEYISTRVDYEKSVYNNDNFWISSFSYGNKGLDENISFMRHPPSLFYINGEYIDYNKNEVKIKNLLHKINKFLVINKIYPNLYEIVKNNVEAKEKIILFKKSDITYNKDFMKIFDEAR